MYDRSDITLKKSCDTAESIPCRRALKAAAAGASHSYMGVRDYVLGAGAVLSFSALFYFFNYSGDKQSTDVMTAGSDSEPE